MPTFLARAKYSLLRVTLGGSSTIWRNCPPKAFPRSQWCLAVVLLVAPTCQPWPIKTSLSRVMALSSWLALHLWSLPLERLLLANNLAEGLCIPRFLGCLIISPKTRNMPCGLVGTSLQMYLLHHLAQHWEGSHRMGGHWGADLRCFRSQLHSFCGSKEDVWCQSSVSEDSRRFALPWVQKRVRPNLGNRVRETLQPISRYCLQQRDSVQRECPERSQLRVNLFPTQSPADFPAEHHRIYGGQKVRARRHCQARIQDG